MEDNESSYCLYLIHTPLKTHTSIVNSVHARKIGEVIMLFLYFPFKSYEIFLRFSSVKNYSLKVNQLNSYIHFDAFFVFGKRTNSTETNQY